MTYSSLSRIFRSPYSGMMTRASTPSLTRALGREPATSARPPDLAKGVASEAAYRIFIVFLLSRKKGGYAKSGRGRKGPRPSLRGATGEGSRPCESFNVSGSDGVVLLNIDREALGTGELLLGSHTHVLIGDNAVQLSAWFHNGILHQDTVSDHSTFLDAKAA